MGILGGLLKDLIAPVTELVGEVVVDKDKRDEINYKIQELIDRTDERYHEQLMGQIEINKIEAASGSLFVAGWRPFIGWVGGVGLAWSFILGPAIEYVARLSGWTGTMPVFDLSQLIAIVLAMLGVGTMRTVEKIKGVSTNDYRDTPDAPINVVEKKKRKKVLGVF